MTPDEAVLLARKVLRGEVSDPYVGPAMRLAAFVLAQSGAADSVPPAVPSEHGLQNAVPTPGDASSASPGEPRVSQPPSRAGGSLANFACCNQCSGEHHHCPSCGGYVRGDSIVYCSTRCENKHKAL